MNMPKYVSRPTEVEADEIVAIDLRAHDLSLTLELAGGGRCVIPRPSSTQHRPFPGDYLIHLAQHNDTYVCPRSVFLEKYRPARTGELTFGEAIEALKLGKKVAREGWNGKGLSIELQAPDEHSKMTLPYIFMNYPATPASETAPANHINARVPWLASQTDMLADDWRVVE